MVRGSVDLFSPVEQGLHGMDRILVAFAPAVETVTRFLRDSSWTTYGTAAAGAAVLGSAAVVYTVLFTRKHEQGDSAEISGPPPSTLTSTLTLYAKVYAIRYVGALLNVFILPAAEVTTTMDVVVDTAPVRRVHVKVYHPTSVGPGQIPHALPVYIDLHGGGFVAGSASDDSEFCRYLAGAVGCVVVSADYSLAPERPAPAAVHDVAAIVQWARQYFHTHRIALGGFSAGGCIALSACAHPSVTGLLDAVVAFYPPVDLSTSSRHTFPVRDPWRKEVFYEAYLRNIAHLEGLADPLVSPAYVPASSFPPLCVILAAGLEPNRVDIADLVLKLKGGDGRPRTVIDRFYPEPIFHGWTHVPEAILRTVRVPKACSEAEGEGAPWAGDGVQAKWHAFNTVAQALRTAWIDRLPP